MSRRERETTNQETACTRLKIDGMMCQASCGSTVETALLSVDGVKSAKASYPSGEALVWWVSGATASVEQAIEAVEAVGFGAAVMNAVVLEVDGMMCQASCGATVQAALLHVDGVESANVSYPDKQAVVVGSASTASLIAAVEAVGFDARVASGSAKKTDEKALAANSTKSELAVHAMSSLSDGKRVQAAVMSVRGALRCDVMVAAGRCVVSHERVAASSDFVRAIRSIGFDSHATDEDDDSERKDAVYLRVEGMSCAACSAKVEKALCALPSVETATVSSTTHKAKITLLAPACPEDVAEMVAAVEHLGFKAREATSSFRSGQQGDDDVSSREVERWRTSFVTALVLTAPILLAKWTSMVGPSKRFWSMGVACSSRLSRLAIAAFVLGSMVQLLVGSRFVFAALRGLRNGNYGMDLLVALATCIVYAYSTLSLVECCAFDAAHDHSMYDTAAMLLLFVSLGKFLEASAKQRASGTIAALLRLQPKMAVKLPTGCEELALRAAVSDNGLKSTGCTSSDQDAAEAELRDAMAACSEFELVKATSLKPGDVVVVEPGSAVPADGVVASALDTVGFVDEAAMTGESTPVAKRRGDVVFGGGINRGSTLIVRATQTGDKAAIAQIARLVEEAQLSKAPVQEYADAIASRFTPTILLLALVTFLTWYAIASSNKVPDKCRHDDDANNFLFALLFGVSVVVVACPCALGLATPTAVMCGTGVGASFGVLFKGGDVLEKANGIDAVVFDKTGTLTTGRPEVTDYVALAVKDQPTGDDWALMVAASAESTSEHPIAKAIVKAARDRSLTLAAVEQFKVYPGRGVAATLKNHGDVAVGSVDMIQSDLGVELEPSMVAEVDRLRRNAKTVVVTVVSKIPVAIFGVADAPRPEAQATLKALRAMRRRGKQIQVWMLTGDHRATAIAVAEQIGLSIDNVEAGVLPAAKSAFVSHLQLTGRQVAMVGDGVNDAPALAAADIGVALGGGTQVAIEAADVVLVKSDLRDVVVALDLAKTVYRRIQLNFVWATVYNLILLPVASGVLFMLTCTRLHPATAALCMAFSSVSVVCSSLALKLYKPPTVDSGRHPVFPGLSFDDDDVPYSPESNAPLRAKHRAAALRQFQTTCRIRCRQWLFSLTGIHFYSKCLDDSDHIPSSPTSDSNSRLNCSNDALV